MFQWRLTYATRKLRRMARPKLEFRVARIVLIRKAGGELPPPP
jgi:hypothetical protein